MAKDKVPTEQAIEAKKAEAYNILRNINVLMTQAQMLKSQLATLEREISEMEEKQREPTKDVKS